MPWLRHEKLRIKVIEAGDQRPRITDLGPGARPTFSPDDTRIAFLIHEGAAKGVEPGIWVMQADGSERRFASELFGMPLWSPDGRQFLVVAFDDPREMSLLNLDKPELPNTDPWTTSLRLAQLGRQGKRGGNYWFRWERRHCCPSRRERARTREDLRGVVQIREKSRRQAALAHLLAQDPSLRIRWHRTGGDGPLFHRTRANWSAKKAGVRTVRQSDRGARVFAGRPLSSLLLHPALSRRVRRTVASRIAAITKSGSRQDFPVGFGRNRCGAADATSPFGGQRTFSPPGGTDKNGRILRLGEVRGGDREVVRTALE